MDELNGLLERLRTLVAGGFSESSFQDAMNSVAHFFSTSLELQMDEVSILITDKDKAVLSFAYPAYLVDSGMIPVTSPDAFASMIYQAGRGFIENSFNQQKHLHLFELIPTPDKKVKPIWKIMGTVLKASGEKFGVIELSRKAEDNLKAGADFSREDLVFLERSLDKIAPSLKKVLPADFRGKIK